MQDSRGLYLLWFIASAIWGIGWTIHVRTSCAVIMARNELVCEPSDIPVLMYLIGRPNFSFGAALLWGLSVPAVTLIGLFVAILLVRRITGQSDR